MAIAHNISVWFNILSSLPHPIKKKEGSNAAIVVLLDSEDFLKIDHLLFICYFVYYSKIIKSVTQLGLHVVVFSFSWLIKETWETLAGIFIASTSSETVFVIAYQQQHEMSWFYPLLTICPQT